MRESPLSLVSFPHPGPGFVSELFTILTALCVLNPRDPTTIAQDMLQSWLKRSLEQPAMTQKHGIFISSLFREATFLLVQWES